MIYNVNYRVVNNVQPMKIPLTFTRKLPIGKGETMYVLCSIIVIYILNLFKKVKNISAKLSYFPQLFHICVNC